MKLPFTVHDGVKKRKCEYSDLYFIIEFKLEHIVYGKRKWNQIKRKRLNKTVLIPIYDALTKIIELNNSTSFNPLSYMNIITVLQVQGIDTVTCKSLSRLKNKPLMTLALDIKKFT